MTTFNLFKEIIIVKKQDLLKAINTGKEFGINIKGDVIYAPFTDKEILIYQSKHTPTTNVLLPNTSTSLSLFASPLA